MRHSFPFTKYSLNGCLLSLVFISQTMASAIAEEPCNRGKGQGRKGSTSCMLTLFKEGENQLAFEMLKTFMTKHAPNNGMKLKGCWSPLDAKDTRIFVLGEFEDEVALQNFDSNTG